VEILGFLQREPAKQQRIQAPGGKDDHCRGENPRKISRSEQQGRPNHRHQDIKHGIDNIMVVVDKAKKFSKPRKFDDIENMHCIWYPNENHTTGDYRIFIDRYTRKGTMEKENKITRKRMKTIKKARGFKNPREW
jgi:hypothetical protein